jgi:uncharacterized protein (TIRG00374 family)
LKLKLSSIIKFVIFLSGGLLVLYLTYLFQDKGYQEECLLKGIPTEDCNLIKKVWSDIKSANYLWVLVVVIAYLFSNFIRAARWLMLIRPMGYTASFANAFLTLMLGYFANLGLPRVGEILRPAALAKYENIPMEKLIGTVFIERVIDVLCLGLIIVLSLVVEFKLISSFILSNEKLTDKLATIFSNPIFWLVIVVLLASGYYFLRLPKVHSHPLFIKIKNIVMGFFEGIKTIFKLKRPFLFIAYSLSIWTLYYLMTYLCFNAFIPTEHLGIKAGLVIFTMGTLGIVIPFPGGMGSYHFLLGEGLKIYGISSGDSFSFANIIFFSIQVFCNIFIGLIAVILLPIINKKGIEHEP